MDEISFYPGRRTVLAACLWVGFGSAVTAGAILALPDAPHYRIALTVGVSLLCGVVAAWAGWWGGSPRQWSMLKRNVPLLCSSTLSTICVLSAFKLAGYASAVPYMIMYLSVWLCLRTFMIWGTRLSNPTNRDLMWNVRPQLIRNLMLVLTMGCLLLLPIEWAYLAFGAGIVTMAVSSVVERKVWTMGARKYNQELND
jgi:hypothetical protein